MFDMTWFRLDGSDAFVTGTGSGIGQGIALGLAQAGADVACFDRDAAASAGTAARIEALGRRALAVSGDVTRPEDLAAVGALIKACGALKVAVNAAGIANATPAKEMPLEQWQRMIDVDLSGGLLSCQADARAMLPAGRGAIINIASMSG